ncbi:MAG: transglycosylase domain-containing protein [Clostridia bacterium]|nr:transglycosylase domain-containing protein [Clostridia bacterium]
MKKAKKISLILGISLVVFLFLAVGLALTFAYNFTKGEVFDSERLVNSDLKINIYDKDNNLIPDKNMFNNQYIKLSNLNPETIEAFISIEDKNFYSHNGVNIKRMAKAMLKNIKSGQTKEGASTISQQLIKNTHLSNEKTYSRKLKEIALTMQMEKVLSKDEILENYFNVIYFGNNIYGIENASKFYFSKPAKELDIGESAILAAIIKSPATYCPINNPEKCLNRRNLVLAEMKEDGKINIETCEKEISKPLQINVDKNFDNGQNSYSQAAIEEATSILQIPSKQIALGEYKIYTYQDPRKQEALKEIIENENISYDKSAISINNLSNGIEAFYGDSSYSILKAKRQPGSTIKPLLVYGPAMNENIISPATKVLDDKIDINGYKPQNYSKSYSGYVSVREAISKSINIPAVKTLSYLGIDKGKYYAKRLGLKFDEKDNGYALALGGMTYGTDIKTLASAYSSFAQNGKYTSAKFISKITDKDNKVIYENNKMFDQVLREDASYLTLSTLITTAKEGTAKKLSSLPYMVAAKTGTVGSGDENTDAYNISLTSEDTIAVWIGNLSGENIGNITGGKQPTTIAKDYFNEIYKKHTPKDFEMPTSITEIEIDSLELDNNHIVLKANDFIPERYKIKEIFSKFNLPKDKSTNFLEINPASLNGRIQNSNNILEFEAENYMAYDLYKLESEKEILLKSFSGEQGKVTFTEPSNKKNSKYFLITKIKNYATNEELISEKSNIVEIVAQGEKIVSNKKLDKWYI